MHTASGDFCLRSDDEKLSEYINLSTSEILPIFSDKKRSFRVKCRYPGFITNSSFKKNCNLLVPHKNMRYKSPYFQGEASNNQQKQLLTIDESLFVKNIADIVTCETGYTFNGTYCAENKIGDLHFASKFDASNCPQGFVSTKHKKSLIEAGFSDKTSKNIQDLAETCVPMPCKWWFSNERNARYSEKNFYRQNVGCVCDFSSGWIAIDTLTAEGERSTAVNAPLSANACFPIFAGSTFDIGHRGADLQYIETPQTLHIFRRPKNSKAEINRNITQALPCDNESSQEIAVMETQSDVSSLSNNLAIISERKQLETNLRFFPSNQAEKAKSAVHLSTVKNCDKNSTDLLCENSLKNEKGEAVQTVVLNKSKSIRDSLPGMLFYRTQENLIVRPISQKETNYDVKI